MSTTFNVNIDGQTVELEINMPTLADQREAQKIYNQAFSDAINSGSIIRAKLEDLLAEQGLWDDKKEIEFKTLQKQIQEAEKQLASGGISLKSAKSIAFKLQNLRSQLKDLISVRTNLDVHTAEGQADNAKFNYFISACVVYKNNRNKYFKDYEDYLNRSIEDASILAAQQLALLMYGLDNDFEKKLPENKFLLKYKFVNNDLDLIDEKGRLVDSEGRLIDKQGRFINEDGKFVDKDGNLVDIDGEYIVDFKPFLDDEGNPISEDQNE